MLREKLFTSADGQILGIASAKLVSTLPIWEGNRNILEDHVKDIAESLGDNIERINHTIFRVALVKTDDGRVKNYIVDGQHRAQVLKEYFEKNPFNTDNCHSSKELARMDFDCLVGIKEFENEADIIKYFHDINRVRAIQWKEDPNVIANKYIKALLDEFQPPLKNGKPAIVYFRHGRTRKPYISIDLVRQMLIAKYDGRWTITPEQFVQQAHHHNQKLYEKIQEKNTKTPSEMTQIEYGFALSNDEKFLWI
jgi:hypothetical protein